MYKPSELVNDLIQYKFIGIQQYIAFIIQIQMNQDCVLCCEEAKLFGITECNHGPFCYRCTYKMRVINKNNSCPICKHKSAQVMIATQFTKFGDFKEEVLPDSNFGDVFHCGKVAKKQFEKLKEYKCFVKVNGKPCKYEKVFDNIAFLKKHLKQQHKRVLCDVCLDKKTCVLEQQKLYTQAQLNKHMQRGDIDDFGNVIFLHPYCGFCKTSFFDEDEFKRHMGLQHMTCNVCGTQHKYVYYTNYDSLETHYKISHYICSDLNCLAKKFIAFKTAEQLKIHRNEYHSAGMKKIDGKQLCGFNYGGVITEDIIELKDKQGINMHDQFLTLKKSKNQAIGEADKQENAVIDLRDFYPSRCEEDEHYHNAFVLKHHKSEDKKTGKEQDAKNTGNKKKKYIQKQQFEKEKPVFAKENEQFFLEQLNLIKSLHLSKIYYEDFQAKLSTLMSSDDLKKLETNRIKHNKRQMSSEEFINNFYNLMKKVSLRAGYEIFPHYIRTVQNEDAKDELDYEYTKTLKKIPAKTKCMLTRCKTYGDLFKSLLNQVEKNIQARINQQTLKIKKPIIREKERLFQLIGVVRRLKTQEMAKMKFATNFGVQPETCEMMHDKIFKMNEQNIQSSLQKIPNEEFIDLYIFIKYCYQAITHNENIHLAKNKIHEKVLEDFLFDRPELDKKFGPKKEELKTLDEKVQFEKEQQERNHQKKLKDMEKRNKDFGYHAQTNFSLNDKSDFPDLILDKKPVESAKDNFRDVVDNAKSKPSTYQKKINELFPTLGSEQNEPTGDKKQKQHKVEQKKEKAWWEKINEPKYDQFGEGEEVVKIRKGKNKKQKWVSGKGFFGH